MDTKRGDTHERLSVEGDDPVGVADGHRRVEEDKAVPFAKPGDLGADLLRPLRVVVADGP
jgi:hypothetical protein